MRGTLGPMWQEETNMNKPKVIAFHGKQKIKDKYVARVKAHAEADEIIQGRYWENGKGCAVGCTIESSNNPHDTFQKELGITWQLALIEDSLFERLQNGESKKFPLEFLEAVPVGADTELVHKKIVDTFREQEILVGQSLSSPQVPEERDRELREKIKSFAIMNGSVIDLLEETDERAKMTNRLNENLEIGYRQACQDVLSLLSTKEEEK